MTSAVARRIRIGVLSLLALVATGALAGPALAARYRARRFTPVMRAYVAAAVAGDSVALVRLSATAQPVRFALRARRTEPGLFALAAEGFGPTVLGRADSGLVRVHFRFRRPYTSNGCRYPFDGIYAAFRRARGAWRLVQAGIGPC